MAIRFFCKRCNQLLGIAARKAGTEIACPKCGCSQTVPNEEAAAAALAMTRSTRGRQMVEDPSDLVVYADEPAAIETPRDRPAQTSSAPATGEQIPRPEAGQPVPAGMILYRRRTLYVQAVLFVLVGAVGFGSGYFMGRGDASFEEQVRRQEAEKVPVLIEGTLLYRPTVGTVAGDEGAVAIALPDGKLPEKAISIYGIRPQDPAPQASDPILRAIEQLGGAYARANSTGAFWMQVPQQGTYRLLLLSRHAARNKASQIEELDADEMKGYFTLPRDLVGRYKYRWTREEIAPDQKPFDHDFGRDGAE